MRAWSGGWRGRAARHTLDRIPESEPIVRSYVVVAGLVFGLLTLAHVWRIVEEPHLAKEPWFIAITVAAAALSVGAWRVARRPKAS